MAPVCGERVLLLPAGELGGASGALDFVGLFTSGELGVCLGAARAAAAVVVEELDVA